VLSALRPIWQAKPETASRVRGRIEKILDAAKAKGLRDGENPARWRGHLENLLPSRQRLSRGHHKAMPYVEVPCFMRRLRNERSMSRLALEFTILTCARTGEVIGARWSEIDLKAKVWTVPAQRMKTGREHRVPLLAGALKVLRALPERGPDTHVFHVQNRDEPLSNMAMAMVLRGLVGSAATVHGFRSSFRDWSAECTNFPREIAEAALAHTVGNNVERAYRRGDALEKRRQLMTAWDDFVSTGRKSAR
jgi:integrase